MKTQAEFAEEILEQCMYGTSVSNLMVTLEEYRKQEIEGARKKAKIEENERWEQLAQYDKINCHPSFFTSRIIQLKTSPSPLDEVIK